MPVEIYFLRSGSTNSCSEIEDLEGGLDDITSGGAAVLNDVHGGIAWRIPGDEDDGVWWSRNGGGPMLMSCDGSDEGKVRWVVRCRRFYKRGAGSVPTLGYGIRSIS